MSLGTVSIAQGSAVRLVSLTSLLSLFAIQEKENGQGSPARMSTLEIELDSHEPTSIGQSLKTKGKASRR